MQTTVLQAKGTDREERRRGLARGNRSCAFAAIPCRRPKNYRPDGLGDEKGDGFYGFAAGRIRDEVRRLYATGGELETSKHLSVLALAPIPLLVVLGNALSNKVQTDFFQCHRDRPERWTWHEDKSAARYTVDGASAPAREPTVSP